MKLAIFKNEADVKEIEKVEGFVGMVGEDCGCRKDAIQKDLDAVGDVAGKLLKDKAQVLKVMEQAPISNKPEWIEAPPKAKILAYWPKDGWVFGTYDSAETVGCGWQGTGYGSWIIPKYKRMDETVKDWKKSLTKRPMKSITMKEGLERIEKIIDTGIEQKKTADIFDKIKGEDKVLQDFAKKLLDYMYKKKLTFANGTSVKDGTGKRFGLMADKNKMMERLVTIGVFTKTEKGWEPV